MRFNLKSGIAQTDGAGDGDDPSQELVGNSPEMRQLGVHLRRVMANEIAVALLGETGTGKELAARAIHQGSGRRRGPFVAINCAAIPPSLQESELFGHVRGAFTGADNSRRGAFEQAHNGTLFLDEVGEMSLETQAVLLRVLEAKAVRRLGGSSETPVDVRIISATSRDLQSEVKAGRFRKDLFYRLVVYPIHLPPLRERASDIPLLVEHFIGELGDSLGAEVHRFHPEALEALMRHDWPGNVRELQNVVSRAMVVCDGPEVSLSHLPGELAAPPGPKAPAAAKPARPVAASVLQLFAPEEEVLPLRELERQAILQALRVTQGNVPKAAQLLEIGRATLYRRLAD